jgi:hypothetical protein
VQAYRLQFSRLPGSFAICQLAPSADIPGWALQGAFFSVTRSADELSVVCPQEVVPARVRHEAAWACLKLEGPFPFSQTGILASFVQPLSDRAIPIFAVSTFDTDYVLVKEAWIDKAIEVLKEAGHQAT